MSMLEQRAGHRVESGREHDAVELELAVADAQAVRRDLVDRCLAHVDQLDVVAVERLEVAGVDAQALAADDRLRRQALGDLGVLHDLADLVAHELGGGVVRVADR